MCQTDIEGALTYFLTKNSAKHFILGRDLLFAQKALQACLESFASIINWQYKQKNNIEKCNENL